VTDHKGDEVPIYDDEFSGQGGSYTVDKDGRRVLVFCTDAQPTPSPEPITRTKRKPSEDE
jgi:hypothetical protein